MAFDGITTANLVKELSDTLTGGGISRIIQPEKDELMITVRAGRVPHILVMSANASLPLLYLTDEKKEAPLSAPNFCMLLRKHLQGGQIISVTQPSLERIVVITIEHRDELGDLRTKKLIMEIMGKYSNIIFTDEHDTIIDSIRRVPSSMSSVREVLPGKPYFIPVTQKKEDPLTADALSFRKTMDASKGPLSKALVASYTGMSGAASEEFLYEAGADGSMGWSDLDEKGRNDLTEVFLGHMEHVRSGAFRPNIIFNKDLPVEFGSFPFRMYAHAPYETKECSSASSMLTAFYGAKERVTRMRQKSADLRHITQTALDRTNRKYQLQEKQMNSTKKRDRYRIYGEMLNTYGYSAEEGARSLTCLNYYTNEEITVPLDPTMTASENAQHYFARYNKLKRTAEALAGQIEETENDREQLESVLSSIDLAESEADLNAIRKELTDFGFITKKGTAKKGVRRETRSAPYHYISSDGFDMYVGRNNYQNEEVTFGIAGNSDWWFHAKGAPGSHVIVKTRGRELPDRAFEEAGALAAYYSSKRSSSKVEIDYTLRKNLRKKNGGKPGFVIYHTNYSLVATPDISGLTKV